MTQASEANKQAREANYDGLIGPTHNYGGLSAGNLASARNAGLIASPRAAALQGLGKMKMMADMGFVQGILPPQARPDIPMLRALGYGGNARDMMASAWQHDSGLMRNLYSASSMWAANAATVSPSADCKDGRLHLTPANLSTLLHRSIEHEQTGRALRAAFPFARVHDALPMQARYSDEGAANHVRLSRSRGAQGVELFVYGRAIGDNAATDFPARQSLDASRAIARLHGVVPGRTVFARQSAKAINAGAFHNDVVCVGALETLFYHQHGFDDNAAMRCDIIAAADGLFDPIFVEVPEAEVPLADAITAYLFNSMLVQVPGEGRLTLIAPLETQEMASTKAYCERLVASNGPIGAVKYVDVRQSMRNGGGPACLRLRVVLTDDELAQCNPDMLMNDAKYGQLCGWVSAHYREKLAPDDLRDPALMDESFSALDALTKILGLGSDFYPFQRAAG
ncbi:MAG: N-succinylarginine dihydrolase [Robiginitomaculum sp.]